MEEKMMQTQGAIGNLLNRYRSVLKKCISFNMFSVLLSLSLSFALLGGTAQAALNVDEGTDAVTVSGGTLESGTYSTDKNLVISSGKLVLGSENDTSATIATSGDVSITGGDMSVLASGNKVSGALVMTPENSRVPEVVPGTKNTFIPDDNPDLVPGIQTVSAGGTMNISDVSVNVGAPRYGAEGPAQADIEKSWEGSRLDFKSGGDMTITGGDFRAANITFPIKDEAKAALRFESAGTLTLEGGTYTFEGAPMGNPARKNYDAPSLASFQGADNLVVNGGTFDLRTARVHMGSENGKVVINDGDFNIQNDSAYPGWTTFDKVGTDVVIRDEADNKHDKYGVFASLDLSDSEVEINGGTFNIGREDSPYSSANYINLAGKEAVFNGGTFNVYGGANFGNNKAGLTINGGTYNMINGGYFGGRNTNGASVTVNGGTFNFKGNGQASVITEAAYLDNDAYNKTSLDINGGTFNFEKYDDSTQETVSFGGSYALNISGGDFVRKADGVNSVTASFASSGQTGVTADASGDINISGGTFRTEKPVNYTAGVELGRDDNIRLYNANDVVDGLYQLHTDESVEAIFATGDEAKIKEAFAPAHNPDYLPTKEEVLTALHAAQNIKVAMTQKAWDFAAAGDLNVTGGTFDFNTVNQSSMSAQGTLNWDGGTLIAQGGGGSTTLEGKEGIVIKSGTIRSLGYTEDGPSALQYDYRGRLDRDRWTLGKYLVLKTDGDIIIGEKGTAGPDVYYSEGMLQFAKSSSESKDPGTLYLNSGTLTLDGQYRSTLTSGNMNSVIDGGTLNIITGDAINRNGLDSASMWTLPLVMKSGELNLYNAQTYATVVNIEGGTVNMAGDSALTSNTGDLNITGGTINVGERSYIGAIKGDSLEYSPYVTATGNIDINNAALNFSVAQPAEGTILAVGTDIGGIYNTVAGTDITIGDGTTISFTNAAALDEGTYTAEGFVESEAGVVNMNDFAGENLFYTYNINKIDDSHATLSLNVKDTRDALAALTNNENVLDNARNFRMMLREAQDVANGALAATFASDSPAVVADSLRQMANESALGGMYAARNTMDMFRGQLNAAGSLGAGLNKMELEHGNRLWVNGMGNWATVDGSKGIQGFDISAGGIVAGYDRLFFNDRVRLGAAIGGVHSKAQTKDVQSKTDGDTFLAGIYSTIDFKPFFLDLNLAYGRTSNDIVSKINMAGVAGSNSGSFDTDSLMASVLASYHLTFNDGATVLAPYLGLEYFYAHQDGYTEHGALDRHVDSLHDDVVTLPVGVTLKHTFKGETFTVTPEVGIAYARDLNEFDPSVRTGYGTATRLSAHGVDVGRDALRVSAGVTTSVGNDLELFARYGLEKRENYTNNQVMVGLQFKF